MYTAQTVNEVDLPAHVVKELTMLGQALEWYTQHQLQTAVNVSAVDMKVVDDPHGVDIYDKMDLSPSEQSFRERIEQERLSTTAAELGMYGEKA